MKSGRLWGIDHGLTFNASEKLRTVIWDFAGLPIPAEIVADLRLLCGLAGRRERRLRAGHVRAAVAD